MYMNEDVRTTCVLVFSSTIKFGQLDQSKYNYILQQYKKNIMNSKMVIKS